VPLCATALTVIPKAKPAIASLVPKPPDKFTEDPFKAISEA
jgi:hypothetical protein